MGYMTDESKLIQDTAREFTSNEVLPVANELDPHPQPAVHHHAHVVELDTLVNL